MSFRCPYCKALIEGDLQAQCPHCGKTMRVPGSLRPNRRKSRRSSTPNRLAEPDRDIPGAEFLARRKPSHLLVILAVMALLGGMLTVKSRNAFKPPRTRKDPPTVARRELDTLCSALELFHTDCGRYPTTKEGLIALINNPGVSSWNGPYVTLIRPDPWKTRYIYRNENELIIILSSGPDRTQATPDDILPTVPVP